MIFTWHQQKTPVILVPKKVISKLSGNTGGSTHPKLQKAFCDICLSTQNWIELAQNSTLLCNYLQFDTKIVNIGEISGLELQKEVYFGLVKIPVILNIWSQKIAEKRIENKTIHMF